MQPEQVPYRQPATSQARTSPHRVAPSLPCRNDICLTASPASHAGPPQEHRAPTHHRRRHAARPARPRRPARPVAQQSRGRQSHAGLGLQVGAQVQQQLHRVLVTKLSRHDQRREFVLRGNGPSTTTAVTACHRGRRRLAPCSPSHWPDRHRGPRPAPGARERPASKETASPGRRETLEWLQYTPRRRALTSASFFQSTGAPTSSSLHASAVLPAFAASHSALPNARSSMEGVVML